jgi:hypothetical protein
MAHNREVVVSNPSTVNWKNLSNTSYYINIHENNEIQFKSADQKIISKTSVENRSN